MCSSNITWSLRKLENRIENSKLGWAASVVDYAEHRIRSHLKFHFSLQMIIFITRERRSVLVCCNGNNISGSQQSYVGSFTLFEALSCVGELSRHVCMWLINHELGYSCCSRAVCAKKCTEKCAANAKLSYLSLLLFWGSRCCHHSEIVNSC